MLRFKTKAQVAELTPLAVTHPLELVHMDFLTIEAGKGNREINVLVITDHFTRYAQDFVTPSHCPSGSQNSTGQILGSLWTSVKILTDRAITLRAF